LTNALKDKVDGIIREGNPWTDSEFPPAKSSLGQNNKYNDVEWKRISEIYKDPKIF
jgi:hypothetical protein